MRPPPRRLARLVLVGVLAATGLSACESLDSFDLFDSKKKLVGDRKPVFPDGVPGVSSGVPPELVKGYREPEGGVADPAKAAAEAVAEPAPKPKKPKPAPQRAASKVPPATNAAAPAQQPGSQTSPWPGQQPPSQAATSPWPASQSQSAWPASPNPVGR